MPDTDAKGLDEYGDLPSDGGNQYATMDSIRTDAAYTDVHTRGSIRRGTGVEFWMTSPRPSGVSPAEWERITQERWDRAFARPAQGATDEDDLVQSTEAHVAEGHPGGAVPRSNGRQPAGALRGGGASAGDGAPRQGHLWPD